MGLRIEFEINEKIQIEIFAKTQPVKNRPSEEVVQ